MSRFDHASMNTICPQYRKTVRPVLESVCNPRDMRVLWTSTRSSAVGLLGCWHLVEWDCLSWQSFGRQSLVSMAECSMWKWGWWENHHHPLSTRIRSLCMARHCHRIKLHVMKTDPTWDGFEPTTPRCGSECTDDYQSFSSNYKVLEVFCAYSHIVFRRFPTFPL